MTTEAQPQLITKPAPKPLTLEDYLVARKPHMEAVLPKHVSVDRVIKVTFIAWMKTDALKKCSMESIFAAVLQACELGLEPSSALHLCALVPFGEKCELVIEYAGFVHLARQSGLLSTVETGIVHENDYFDHARGLNPRLEHRPLLKGDRGEVLGAYVVTELADGKKQADFMRADDINAIRDKSAGYRAHLKWGKASTWVDHWGEMARKTVLKRNAKLWPKSPELATALALDDQADAIDVEFRTEKKRGTAGAKAALEAKREHEQLEPEPFAEPELVAASAKPAEHRVQIRDE